MLVLSFRLYYWILNIDTSLVDLQFNNQENLPSYDVFYLFRHKWAVLVI